MKKGKPIILPKIAPADARRMASYYMADMSAAMRNLSKTYQVDVLEKLFESAYYCACMEASGLTIPADEMEFLKSLHMANRKYR